MLGGEDGSVFILVHEALGSSSSSKHVQFRLLWTLDKKNLFLYCIELLKKVTAFGWCGSAVMGGWLVDQYDYGATFFATALVQACAVLVWLSLAPLVSNKELRAAMPAPLPTSDLPASVPESAKDSSDEVQSPLYQPTTEARKLMDTMAIAERFSE
jgi:hypothetical protein